MLGTDRLRSTALFEKITTPEQAAALIEDGMNAVLRRRVILKKQQWRWQKL